MLVIAGVSSACWYIGLTRCCLSRGQWKRSRETLGLSPFRLSIRAKLLDRTGSSSGGGLGTSAPEGAVLWNNDGLGRFPSQ